MVKPAAHVPTNDHHRVRGGEWLTWRISDQLQQCRKSNYEFLFHIAYVSSTCDKAEPRTCQLPSAAGRGQIHLHSPVNSLEQCVIDVRPLRKTTNHVTWRPVAIIILKIFDRKNARTRRSKTIAGQTVDGRRNCRGLQKSIPLSSYPQRCTHNTRI